MDGFFLIDKPVGMTSHDVVRFVKKQFKIDKIGHTGTLDPFATGLLILCLGKATKLSQDFIDMDKEYEGTIAFNRHYDTYDTTGTVIKEKVTEIDLSTLEEKVTQMIGVYDQEPPMYSAIKVQGKKLYEHARKQETVARARRTIEIYDFFLTSSLTSNQIDFKIKVSKGTYIRSVAVDLAEKLDTYGALSQLRRTQIGSYRIENAKTLTTLNNTDLIALDTYLKQFPKLILEPYLIHLVKNGVYLDERQTTIDQDFVVYSKDGQMIALYERIKTNTYKPKLIL